MLKTYVAVCHDVEQFRLTPQGARERARVLSLALCPEPAEVRDTTTRELLALYMDGTELPLSLHNLVAPVCGAAAGGIR